MDLGIQHSVRSAAIHDLEEICDRRCVECLRRGDDPDEDVGLEYLERLVREVSIGVNQVKFNMENLAILTGNTFTRPPRPDSPIFYGVCRAASASDTSVDRQDTGGEWTLTQWVHCEFVVSFEAIHPVVTQQVCGEFF